MTKTTSHHDIEKELITITKQFLLESGERQREIKLSASLQKHLGIDSLGRAELFQRIEKQFGVSVPDRLLAEAETLQDIADFLALEKPSSKHEIERKIITTHGAKSIVDPLSTQTLIDVLLLYGEKSPEKPHIYFQPEDGQEEIITYGQLLQKALRVANGLRERGLKEGETVAIMQPTNPGFFYTFLGTLLAGGIPVPIYPPFRMHMLEAYIKTEARILRNAEVRILVTFEQAENLSRLVKAFVPSLNVVTTVNELLHDDAIDNIFSAKAENFAFIQYTSGSTSDPKGVLLSHFNLLTNIRAYGKAVNVNADTVAVSWLPLYHDMGLIGMWLGSLYFGTPLILLTPFSFLNRPEKWLWAIHYHRGTHSGAPNFAYELCVRKIDAGLLEGLDLSSWQMAANGAEKVYPKTLEAFAKKFAPYGFNRKALLPVYGLAESTVALTIPPLNREFRVDKVERKSFEEMRYAQTTKAENALEFVACGKPLENHQIRIVDDDNTVLAERHVGNLQFSGPSSMQGYYHNPRATQAVYHDGWIDTGDLAYIADGEVFITGRRKDLIIKAGRNLYPAEIEEIVGGIAGVRQGCVTAFAVTDGGRGTEQLVVVAETREKNKAKRTMITEQIRETIATVLDIVPDHIVLVPPQTVPKTSSGKLQRAACKTMYLEGKLGRVHTPTWLQMLKIGAQWLGQNILSSARWLAKFIYTIYLAFIIVVTALPMWFIILLVNRDLAHKLCRKWAQFLLLLGACPIKKIGAENLTKVTPVIFAANHASYFDSIVMLATLPDNVRFIIKKELRRIPILRTFINKLDCVTVDRMDLTKGIEDTKSIEQVLQAGHSILIFPEGTFGYASGLRPFRLGAFKAAVETGVAICPIALQGTRAILRDDEKLFRPGRLTITICEPVTAAGQEWRDVTQLRTIVRNEIAKYCGEPSLDFIAAQVVAPRLDDDDK